MLLRAAQDLNIDLESAYMIGDGITDIQAGRAAGTRTIFIGQAKEYIMDAFEAHGVQPDFIVRDLSSAVAIIERQGANAANQGADVKELRL